MSVTWLQSLIHAGFDEAQLFDLLAGVEPLTALTPLRDDQPIAILPGAQGGGGDID
jgi:hypothetical protein